jgi:hypothetical protein
VDEDRVARRRVQRVAHRQRALGAADHADRAGRRVDARRQRDDDLVAQLRKHLDRPLEHRTAP